MELPILEFDESETAIIQPSKEDYDFSLPCKCIAIFFKDVVEEMSRKENVYEIGRVTWETGDVVFYMLNENGEEVCFYHTWVGAPISAAVLDLAIALGAKDIISIGGCGVIDTSLAPTEILIPTSGVVDEGTSYHYKHPVPEVFTNNKLLERLIAQLEKQKIGYTKVKTWTTDGFYRETATKTKKQIERGCSTVDMEFTAMCSVSEFRKVNYAAIFYAGDKVEEGSYDERDWQNNHLLRTTLLDIAKKTLMED